MARLAGVADIDPQRLLPQCTVGDLHAKDLLERHDILRRKPARPEEAASGLYAGQDHHAHVPAGKERLLLGWCHGNSEGRRND